MKENPQTSPGPAVTPGQSLGPTGDREEPVRDAPFQPGLSEHPLGPQHDHLNTGHLLSP